MGYSDMPQRVRRLVDIVATQHGLPPDVVVSPPDRTRRKLLARNEAVRLVRHTPTPLGALPSWPQIARWFDRGDHTTMMYAAKSHVRPPETINGAYLKAWCSHDAERRIALAIVGQSEPYGGCDCCRAVSSTTLWRVTGLQKRTIHDGIARMRHRRAIKIGREVQTNRVARYIFDAAAIRAVRKLTEQKEPSE